MNAVEFRNTKEHCVNYDAEAQPKIARWIFQFLTLVQQANPLSCKGGDLPADFKALDQDLTLVNWCLDHDYVTAITVDKIKPRELRCMVPELLQTGDWNRCMFKLREAGQLRLAAFRLSPPTVTPPAPAASEAERIVKRLRRRSKKNEPKHWHRRALNYVRQTKGEIPDAEIARLCEVPPSVVCRDRVFQALKSSYLKERDKQNL
ncbi:MAG: hypothetical protein ABSE73_16605 [Planctomycetota bacterium]